MSNNELIIRNSAGIDNLNRALQQRFKASDDHLRVRWTRYNGGRSLSANNLLHKWFGQISEQLTTKGKFWLHEPIGKYGGIKNTPETVKEMLKVHFLGVEQKELPGVNGQIFITQELRHTADLDKDQFCHFMREIEVWATENQLYLTHPEDNEYTKWAAEQR